LIAQLRKKSSISAASFGLSLRIALLGGCGSAEKAPAEAAIKATEAALETVRGEAARYVPDELRSVEDALKSAKASFDKGEYKAALTAAQDLPGKVKGIGAAAAAKKAELTRAWDEISGGVPKMAEPIKSRLDILSQSKKLPVGLDKEKFEGARAGLDALNKGWTEASDAAKSGNLTEALSKGKAAKDKAVEVMTALNMQVPAAAK
jgi:hypothetical protein